MAFFDSLYYIVTFIFYICVIIKTGHWVYKYFIKNEKDSSDGSEKPSALSDALGSLTNLAKDLSKNLDDDGGSKRNSGKNKAIKRR